jgi:hypothetical protein
VILNHRGRSGLIAGLALACCTTLAERALAADESDAPTVTFEDAVALYKAGDMAGANRDFLLLANSGLATADMNLSVMSAHGDGSAVDLGSALGWLTAAKQLGAQVSDAQLQQLVDATGVREKSRADAVLAHYGRSAVAQRLKERIEECSKRTSGPTGAPMMSQPAEWTPPKTLKIATNLTGLYPARGLEEGLPSIVVVRAWVDIDGRAKHVTVDASFPLGWHLGFQEAAAVAMLHSKFSPATLNGRPVGAWKFLRVHFSPGMRGDMLRAGALARLHGAAVAGDPVGEALWVVMSRLDETQEYAYGAGGNDTADILISSALRGYAESEAELSRRLCVAQDSSVWRLRAASDGDVGVLSFIVEYAYDHMYEPAERAQILRLLGKATATGDPTLARKVVWIRASARDPGLRDAQGAVQLAWSLLPYKRADPDYALAYAAAQAANGNFKGAQEAQQWAMDKAEGLSWDLAPLRATLMKYQSGEMDPAAPAEFQQFLHIAR